MISRSLLAVIGAVMLLASAATTALAETDSIQGAPSLTPDCPKGYYLWRDEGGFHLRTHGPGEDHLFTARLARRSRQHSTGDHHQLRLAASPAIDDGAAGEVAAPATCAPARC